jgi:plasmid stabilization system protein ParE
MRIDYHPAIAGELEEIRDHYESCTERLGAEFIDEFERQVLTIAAMPTRWMLEQGDVRRSLMRRFPYVILFRLISDDWIRITVIKHEKRHPAFGRSRR